MSYPEIIAFIIFKFVLQVKKKKILLETLLETNAMGFKQTNKTNTTKQTKRTQHNKTKQKNTLFLGPDNLHILFLVLYGH